jgi:hypothetical protein
MRTLAAIVVGLWLAAGPANATILAQCQEGVGCTLQGSVTTSTVTTTFDSTYSRQSLGINLTSSTVIPPANRIDLPFSSASSDFWLSFRYLPNNAGTTSGAVFVAFSVSGVYRLLLLGTGTNQQIKISKRNAAGTVTDLATATGSTCSNAATPCRLDVHVVYAASGSVNVYNNGTLIATYSGDTTTDSATNLDTASLGTLANNITTNYSEMMVADVDTRSLRLLACAPQAAGATQQWSGAAVGNINEVGIDDTTFNSTGTSNQRSNWTLCSLPSGNNVVSNVTQCDRLSRSTAGGPQNYRHTLYIGSTNYDSPSDISPSTSLTTDCYNWGANSPATGAAWTNSEISSMQAGVLSKP